jgi:sugar-specific transcriptional regulator TrmB
MSTDRTQEEAVDVLQQLGLKEYEAKCFVGLSRLPSGTAKQLSEVTDVPRTRVYDAIRVLEAQGLVEVHHSSPQQFRAVPIDEATETLRDQYEARVQRLADALDRTERVDLEEEESPQEVWTLTRRAAISNRTNVMLREATDEVVFVLGDGSLLTEELLQGLNDVAGEADLLLGAVSESIESELSEAVPDARTFVSDLGWLHGSAKDDLAIGRLLLVDRSTFLVSTILADTGEEQAIVGTGFRNGLVVIARRILSEGLVEVADPPT